MHKDEKLASTENDEIPTFSTVCIVTVLFQPEYRKMFFPPARNGYHDIINQFSDTIDSAMSINTESFRRHTS